MPISALDITTDEERRLFERGEKNHLSKRQAAKIALKKQAPNEQEAKLIHALWRAQVDYTALAHQRKPDASATTLPMSASRIQSVQIMQPQYRNRHQIMVFGGFLLKTTFELAYTCVSSISPAHSRPRFIALDPSTFENPVPVGSTLYLSAVIAYTDSPLVEAAAASDAGLLQDGKLAGPGKTWVQVRVDSKVRDMDTGEVKSTGQFNYNFEVRGEVEVFPETYGEFMVFLDARRRCLLHKGEEEDNVL